MTPSKTYIYFGIRGDFDPAALAAEIGLEPTSCKAKHSRDPEKMLPPKSSLRFAQTHAPLDDPSPDIYHLADLVCGILKDHAGQIAESVRAHDLAATFQVVLDFPVSDDISTPAIGFSDEVVRFVARTGASIDIDTYRA